MYVVKLSNNVTKKLSKSQFNDFVMALDPSRLKFLKDMILQYPLEASDK